MEHHPIKPEDFEILVRRWGPTQYAAYCPQLRIMVKGSSHEEVEAKMAERIQQYLRQHRQDAGDLEAKQNGTASSPYE